MRIKFYYLLLVFVLIWEFTFAQDNRIAYVKDPELIVKNNYKPSDSKTSTLKIPEHLSIVNHDPIITSFGSSFFTPLDITSVYDIQSNRTQVWQDPIHPANVHIVYMYTNDTGFADRRCAYYFSNDNGNTFGLVGKFVENVHSGFPTITGLTTGSAVIACHGSFAGGPVRTNIFVDVGAGFGAFGRLDPVTPQLWPAIVTSSTGQIVFAASGNTNRTTSIVPPGTFAGYNPYYGDVDGCDFALSPSGKIGHAYVGDPSIAIGDVFFRESTDNGLSWNIPKKIWDYGITKSFLGCLKGVSIVYGNNDQPYVTFETIKMTSDGGFFPGLPSKIRIWSPVINNGTNKIIADENNVPFFPNQGVVSDGFAPVCRPVIGRSSGAWLAVAFSATTGNVSSFDSSAFYSIYLTMTFNGSNWTYPEKITPGSPLRDWRYVSISKTSHAVGPYPEVQLFSQYDEVAGSHVHGAPVSHARYSGIKIFTPVGINDPSSSIPEIFSLKQNYPNPFNPETSIEYTLKKSINISLKVFDISGKEIETLVNEKQSEGSYSVKWNASNYPSGVYFYELRSEGFVETRRMMLLK